ncbi:MAG: hypothetical protein AAF653_02930 [Chloroflexota bacterium]
MFKRTQDAIEELNQAEWFGSIGDELHASGLIQVTSWSAAFFHCSTDNSVNAAVEARNKIKDVINIRFSAYKSTSERSSRKAMAEIRTMTDPIVSKKLQEISKEISFPERIVRHIGWDISTIAFAVEYSDVYESAFYMAVRDIYMNGRFYCGWDGKYPQGKMIVF